jgi:flagellar assembly factor FliW
MVEDYVKINTTRFGELEVAKQDILTFKEGLLGFDNLHKFFVVDPGDQTLILWLQSTEDESVAFPIIEPRIFKPDFTISLLPIEMQSVGIQNISEASVYTILTIPQNVTEMSANMKAPIIINNKSKVARQIVLQNNKLEVRYPMYKALKSYIVSYSSDDSRRTTVEAPSYQPDTTRKDSEEVTTTKRRPEVQA